MLKGTAQSIAIPLCKLFNMSISTVTIPQGWRTSNIVPVHKFASKGLVSNYRPILLCTVRRMYSKMEDNLNSNNILSEAQWVFRPSHSAGSALIRPTQHWLKTLHRVFCLLSLAALLILQNIWICCRQMLIAYLTGFLVTTLP